MKQHFAIANKDLLHIKRLFIKIEGAEEEKASSDVTVPYCIFMRKFLDFSR